MTQFEKAKLRARELDRLHPNFIHMVGIRYNIIRVRKHKDDPHIKRQDTGHCVSPTARQRTKKAP